jgi:hypothetical protein
MTDRPTSTAASSSVLVNCVKCGRLLKGRLAQLAYKVRPHNDWITGQPCEGRTGRYRR